MCLVALSILAVVAHRSLDLPIDVAGLEEEGISLRILDLIGISLDVLADLFERMLSSES